MIRSLNRQQLFLLDFFCALAGASLYYFLFDFLEHKVGVPHSLLMTQFTANSLYAMYGALLFIGDTQNVALYRFLMIMNGLYAGFCLIAAAVLLWDGLMLATALLFAEALLIAGLAWLEFKILRKN